MPHAATRNFTISRDKRVLQRGPVKKAFFDTALSHILSYSCFHFTDPSDGQVDGENTDEKVMGGEGQIPPKVRKTLSEKDIN